VTGRSPARLLAPLALVVCAVALYAVVSSGEGDSSDGSADSARPEVTSTATAKPTKKSEENKASGKTYTVQPGDTPSSIAEQTGVPLEEILRLNPDLDPQTLSPGERIRLRQ
jgi:LysM repeat protein